MKFVQALKQFEENDMVWGGKVELATKQDFIFHDVECFVSHQEKFDVRQKYWFVLSANRKGQYDFISFDVRELARHFKMGVPSDIEMDVEPLCALVRFLKRCEEKNNLFLYFVVQGARALSDQVIKELPF